MSLKQPQVAAIDTLGFPAKNRTIIAAGLSCKDATAAAKIEGLASGFFVDNMMRTR